MKRNYNKLLMNLISLRGIFVFTICLVMISLGTLQAQTPQFDELKMKFERGEIFNASFSHEFHDSYTNERTHTEGEIWIGGEKYRVESDEQVMVVDGEISRVYDNIRNRLLISEYDEEEDDFAPSRMLQGVDETYSVQEQNSQNETRITLSSDDPFAIFKTVEITLDSNGNPVVILATDQVDNLLTTRFENGRFQDFAQTLFELDIPENAERIDLRH
jgi:outer membrane lipoprotein-sorting protein